MALLAAAAAGSVRVGVAAAAAAAAPDAPAPPSSPAPSPAPAPADARAAPAQRRRAGRKQPALSAEHEVREALFGDKSGYDRLSFPWAAVGPANVSVSTVFYRVLGVDLYSGSMKIAVWLRMSWTDPRLTWCVRGRGGARSSVLAVFGCLLIMVVVVVLLLTAAAAAAAVRSARAASHRARVSHTRHPSRALGSPYLSPLVGTRTRPASSTSLPTTGTSAR